MVRWVELRFFFFLRIMVLWVNKMIGDRAPQGVSYIIVVFLTMDVLRN